MAPVLDPRGLRNHHILCQLTWVWLEGWIVLGGREEDGACPNVIFHKFPCNKKLSLLFNITIWFSNSI